MNASSAPCPPGVPAGSFIGILLGRLGLRRGCILTRMDAVEGVLARLAHRGALRLGAALEHVLRRGRPEPRGPAGDRLAMGLLWGGQPVALDYLGLAHG